MSPFKKIMKYVVRNWMWFTISVAAMLISTYINVYIPKLSGRVIENILEIGDFNLLVSLVLQILGLTGVLAVFSLIQRYANGYFSQKIVFDVRNDAFKSIQRQSFGFFDKMQIGQLMSRVTTDVNRIRGFVGWQLRMLFSSVFLLVGVIVSMITINLELTLISFSIIPILFFSYGIYGKKIRPIIHTAREYYGNLTSMLWENITGIRVVRSFAQEEYEMKKFQEPNRRYYEMMMKAVKLRSIFNPIGSLIVGFSAAMILWYGGVQIIRNQFTVDQLYVFTSYLTMLIRPAIMLGMIWTGYQRMMAAAERVFEIIDAVPEVKDKPDAIRLPSIKGHVVFENVSFGYDEEKLVLKNVSFEAKPGETVALLGPTGSGKSTIIRLIPRFYDVTSGRILIDGYDIRDVKIKDLRKHTGIVSQETFLFNMSVKENIAFGKPNASMDDIIRVAKIAKAHGFIMNLPKGYDTIVGERGVTLSGGQQQRIAIARALLMDPKILIMDDSTSSIDVDTEYEIQQALNALLKNRTAFIVTQRISTIRNADKIIVIEDGRIVEEGNHETLMAKKGLYYKLYQTLYEAQKEILQPDIVEHDLHKPKIRSHNPGAEEKR
ncbi:TPA: ABC transporter ATP-binding protein [Candidatus Bathyarchaeota archaeon]|nr:ABC transporter ATP-binding protein [Candidatus Bathyarchaeota archaeon]